jgi:hypothetical protein
LRRPSIRESASPLVDLTEVTLGLMLAVLGAPQIGQLNMEEICDRLNKGRGSGINHTMYPDQCHATHI